MVLQSSAVTSLGLAIWLCEMNLAERASEGTLVTSPADGKFG